MSRHIDQLDLGKIVAQCTGQANDVVDAFMDQLFKEVEKGLVTDSSLKVEGLGFFRIIKSGSSNKILFMGDRITPKTIEQRLPIDKPSEYFEEQESDSMQECDHKAYSPSELQDIEASTENGLEATSGKKKSDAEHKTTTASAIDNRPRGQFYAERNSVLTKNNRKLNLIKTTVIGFVVLIISAILYLLLVNSAKAQNKINFNVENSFIELSNPDSLLYNYVIQSQADVSVQHIAKCYYGNEVFWPYIYYENQSNVDEMYTILAGTSIKIPRITVNLADVYNGKVLSTAKDMAQKISEASL